MSHFDAFEGNIGEDADPAADFLAREQSELAGLDDDNFGEVPQENNQDFNGFEQPGYDLQNAPSSHGGGFDVLDSNSFDFVVDGTNDSNAQVDYNLDFSDGGGDLFNTINVDVLNEQSSFENQPSSNGPSNMYEAISQQDADRAVPEKIQIWREEQKARLEQKDAEEEKRRKELKEKAKKEIDDWYKHHAEQFEKTKGNNRAAEKAFIKDRDESIPGQAWEKITRLCEFNPKNSKCTKDVTRFRSILLQLKQSPLVR